MLFVEPPEGPEIPKGLPDKIEPSKVEERWGKPSVKIVESNGLKDSAEWLLSLARVPRDRKFSQPHFDFLRGQYEAGKLHDFEWVTAMLDNTLYRINGQHSAWLVMKLQEVPSNLKGIIKQYKVNSEADLAVLWSTYDNMRSGRTSSQIIAPIASTHPTLAGFGDKVLVAAAKAFAYAQYGDAASAVDPAQRAEMLVADIGAAKFMCEMLHGDKHRFLHRMGVGGAMVRTYRKNKTDAKTFWSLVRDGNSTSAIVGKLRDWLMTTNVRSGLRSYQTRSGAAEPREHCYRSLRAWNSWRKNPSDENPDFRYFSKSPLPEAE